jgi:hypothetical protein
VEIIKYILQGAKCKFNSIKPKATKAYAMVRTEAALMEAVATKGPIAVAINARAGFMYYSSGPYLLPQNPHSLS